MVRELSNVRGCKSGKMMIWQFYCCMTACVCLIKHKVDVCVLPLAAGSGLEKGILYNVGELVTDTVTLCAIMCAVG